MARKDTDLPFGDAFSPGSLIIDDEVQLPLVLELVKKHEGDVDTFTQEIADIFYSDSPNPQNQAKNVPLALGAGDKDGYELVSDNFEFTDIGQELYDLRNDEDGLYDRLAVHILQNLHGRKIVDIIRDLIAAGEKTTTKNIARQLDREYDLYLKESSTHWNQMRGWLAEADLINTRTWKIKLNNDKIDELLGVDRDRRIDIDGLSDDQWAFLITLVRLNPDEPIQNNKVRELAEDTHGVYLDSKSNTAKVLDPLKELDLIDYRHTADNPSKPSEVWLTDKARIEALEPVLEDTSDRTGVPRQVLRMSISEIQDQMDSDMTFLAGRALEALAIKIGLILGLEFEAWQERGVESTGGAEVDVIMDSEGVTLDRWQIQCKNYGSSNLRTKHVAKEVGLSRMLNTNTVLMVTTSDVVLDARQFANKVMQKENFTILFLTGDEIDQIEMDPHKVSRELKRQAQKARDIKRVEDSD